MLRDLHYRRPRQGLLACLPGPRRVASACAAQQSAAGAAESGRVRPEGLQHALRTPLTALHGALGLLGAGLAGELPPEAQALVTLALRNCTALESAVEGHLREAALPAGEGCAASLNRDRSFG